MFVFQDNTLLVSDLLAVHLIRNVNASTIVSFHPTFNLLATTAASLHERMQFVGMSFVSFCPPKIQADDMIVNRSEHILAKDVPTIRRPHCLSLGIYVACPACLG